jgi:3-hydroxyacyl-CoA dehydrogenase/enoyl-CoA hydratase/3-hydroxybutyryl-CoA epimerase
MVAALTLTRRADGVASLVFDKPGKSVNTLDAEVFAQLEAILVEVEKNPPKGLLLQSGKPKQFIAGADVNVIASLIGTPEAMNAASTGRDFITRFSRLPFPTAALITGATLGGGLEWALACDHILAADDPAVKLGLPEVQLGILPGWGGTARLPRRLGLAGALDMLLTGKRLDARRALKAGLVDAVAPANQLEAAALRRFEATGWKKITPRSPGGLKVWLLEKNPLGRSVVFSQARKSVLAQSGGHYPSPLMILDVVEKSWGAPLDTALANEAAGLAPLIASDIAKNLVGIYLASEAAKKNPYAENGEAQCVPQRVMVIGAGVMGSGIAVSLLQAGLSVWLKEVAPEPLLKGVAETERWLDKDAKRKRLSATDARNIRQRLTATLSSDPLSNCDLAIEAVVEKMAVKKTVFAECEAKLPAGALLTSNTSSLSLTEMQQGAAHPELIAGLHFFNPAPLMPLVEIVRGEKSSNATLARLHALVVKMGKTPVVVKDGPGFLVNRLLAFYLNEAAGLAAAGVPLRAIDQSMEQFGMKMGPIELMDVVGLDIATHAGGVLEAAWPERAKVPQLLKAMVEAKRLGKKSGQGFYQWNGEKRGEPLQLPIAAGTSTTPTQDGFVARLIYPMINEAATCLDEGIVDSAAAVDLAMIFGTGFAPFRGGLLKYADTVGPAAIASVLEELAKSHGAHLAPGAALKGIAATGRKFYS